MGRPPYIGFVHASLVVALGIAMGTAGAFPSHVEGWGNDIFGQATPPPNLSEVMAIAAGSDHSLALRSNGTVVAWGSDFQGETVIPAGLSNVVAIAARGHNVALKVDGSVFVWGHNDAFVTNVPPGLAGVVAIAAGNSSGNPYTVAVRSDGTVAAWGLMPFATNVPVGLNGIVAVAAGNSHVLALKNDGTVVGWGENDAGQATPPPGLNGVAAVRAGQSTSFAVKSNGTVVGWGAAVVPAGLTGIVDLQDGNTHTIALRTNGEVIAWGDNSSGQGTVPPDLSDVTAISAGGNHNLVITPRPLILSISSPVVANIGDTVMFSVVATGGPLSYQWQRNGANLPGATNSSLTLTNVQAGNAGTYRVRVANPFGSVLSPPVSLSFPPLLITMSPPDLTVYRGETAILSVSAEGLEPLTYQWRKADVNLPGATNATLIFLSVRLTNEGVYNVVITDAAGGTSQSANASLTVIDPTLPATLALTPAGDTSIFSSGSNPQGISSILAGTRNNGVRDRGLLRFEIDSLPPGAVIHSARLQLTVTRVPRSPVNSDFSLHRLLRFWGPDASWNFRTSGMSWSVPGAASPTDYSAVRSATRFIMGGGTYEFGPAAQLTADVIDWINNPESSYGWILKTENEAAFSTARHFGSAESAQPPRLLIDYSTPAPQPHLTNLSLQNGNFTFRFNGTAGWIYRVESRPALSGAWTTITNAPAGAATNAIVITVPYAPPHRFYRVLAE
jgi:hypothetical protein